MSQNQEFNVQRNSVDVILIDGLKPEEGAMSQSLYSRKPKSILSHLIQVIKKGAGSFMEMFYVEYNHKSIGDCGSTTLYFENVSMLAAKAIQNWALYNGQEASTRYLDFSGRIMINPLGGLLASNYLYIPKGSLQLRFIANVGKKFRKKYEETPTSEAGFIGKEIQEKWMAFYEKHLPLVKEYVALLNPKKEDQDGATYQKAVNARAFDIMRAFIPAGMTTMVSWHSNLRQLKDHLEILKYHPSSEVSRAAHTAISCLQKTYPSSFVSKKIYPETEDYLKLRAEETSYFDETLSEDFLIDDSKLDIAMLNSKYAHLLVRRPQKTEVPHEIGEAGTVNIKFLIDFGSFRDAQRHRKGVCKMPLLTTGYGFNPWYLDRLPEQSRAEALALIEELQEKINNLPCSEIERQYYIPMGYMVVCDFTWSFDQCIYVAELRSSDTVHPTFRAPSQKIGEWIRVTTPHAALYVDDSDDTWSYKRGAQDITEK